ncbi:MAG: DUF6266 family protein [Prevotellaceae bacterium]|jgi:hypothetical protein|nr:DUF6266 family protein [Prevotellaceae bacterium]
MSVLTPSVFGKAKKSTGGVVFYNLNGQQVSRIKAAHISNPRSVAQQYQRAKMAILVAISAFFRQAFNLGFPTRNKVRSPYNEFTARNISTAFVDVEGSPTLQPSELVIAKGTLQTPTINNVTQANANEIAVSLTSTIDNITASTTDNVHVLAYSDVHSITAMATAKRADSQTINVIYPTVPSGTTLYIYVFATTANGAKASDNSNTTHVTTE